MKVVPLREAPSLQDIAGQLELLAADVRRGVEVPTMVLAVLRDGDGNLVTYAFGQTGSEDECAGVLLRAAMHRSDEAVSPKVPA